MTIQRKFISGAVSAEQNGLGPRQVRVVANSGKSDRVKDVLVAKGCKLDNYLANPIVLADHNRSLPIGNFAPEIKGDAVEGVLTFAPEGVSAKADEYCGLYKAGVMKTVSVGFSEVDGEPIKGGGWLYKQWELLELSCVAVSCDPAAVVTARSAPYGEERTAPHPEEREARLEGRGAVWKCGASQNLPLLDLPGYDPEAAAARIFAKAGFDGDDPDFNWARKGFLAFDPANPKNKDSYLFPFADVVDGRLVAVKSGLETAAEDHQGFRDIDAALKAGAVLAHYKTTAAKEDVFHAAKAPKIKSLYAVASLAYLLEELGCHVSCAEWEAEMSGDASKVPAMLAAALSALAEAFLAMSAEEVAELLARHEIEIPADLAADDSLPEKSKRIRAVFRKAAGDSATKAGRKISGKNAASLDEALKCVDAAAGHIKTVRSEAEAADEEDGDAAKRLAAAAHRKRQVEISRFSAVP